MTRSASSGSSSDLPRVSLTLAHDGVEAGVVLSRNAATAASTDGESAAVHSASVVCPVPSMRINLAMPAMVRFPRMPSVCIITT